jgi:nucleoside-diphosphate-sugar epimerase
MKTMITGSTGFVGRHLIPALLQQGHEILEITIEPDVSESIFGTSTSKFALTDNQDELVTCVKEYSPEVIIHLASYLTSADNYLTLQKLLKANVEFFSRVLDCTRHIALKLFINTGSFSEYYEGKKDLKPAYLYSATKIAARSLLDYYARIGGFNQTTVVPYTIYGGLDSQKKIIDYIYDSLDNPITADLSPGEQVLDFIHISDIVRYYSFVVDNCDTYPKNSEFQLGTGVGTSIQELAGMVEEKTQMRANINWGGRPYRESDIMYAVAINTGYNIEWKSKISLSEGLDTYIQNKNSL